ncbi:MAG: hypothetical protein ACRDNS_07330 [Trebonia sp.]
MFLSGILFVLFLAGCWLYCLTDAALTPATEFRGLRKPVWLTVIAATFIAGAVAWTVSRRLWRVRYWSLEPATRHAVPRHLMVIDDFGAVAEPDRAAEALARHPASRSRNAGRVVPIGPDDDPEFLRELAARIRGEQ